MTGISPIVSGVVPTELRVSLDSIATELKITRSQTIALLLEYAVAQYQHNKTDRFQGT